MHISPSNVAVEVYLKWFMFQRKRDSQQGKLSEGRRLTMKHCKECRTLQSMSSHPFSGTTGHREQRFLVTEAE